MRSGAPGNGCLRPAAIKLIRAAASSNGHVGVSDEARQRFECEPQVIARLRSPHTVDLFDFGVAENGAFYYVMELLEGLCFFSTCMQHCRRRQHARSRLFHRSWTASCFRASPRIGYGGPRISRHDRIH